MIKSQVENWQYVRTRTNCIWCKLLREECQIRPFYVKIAAVHFGFEELKAKNIHISQTRLPIFCVPNILLSLTKVEFFLTFRRTKKNVLRSLVGCANKSWMEVVFSNLLALLQNFKMNVNFRSDHTKTLSLVTQSYFL